jgi:hypothetical protein
MSSNFSILNTHEGHTSHIPHAFHPMHQVLSLLTDPIAPVNLAITALTICSKETVSYGGIGATGDAIVEGLLNYPIPSIISFGNI